MPTKQEEKLRGIANALDEILEHQIYGQRMGFFLSVFEFNKEGSADYISNAEREDAIKALRETADRLEKNQVIPVTIGKA